MKLYIAPLSSYSMKAQIAVMEKNLQDQVEFIEVQLKEEDSRREYLQIYPLGKVPLLINEEKEDFVPEASTIIEYFENNFETGTQLIPSDKHQARKTRFYERMFDNYVNENLYKVFLESQKEVKDTEFLAKANFQISTILDLLEGKMQTGDTWIMGDDFTMADIAAFPNLFFATKIHPFAEKYPNVEKYYNRLMQRPSILQCIESIMPELKKLGFVS